VKRVFRWIGIGLGGLIGLAVVIGCVLYVVGGSKLKAKHEVAAERELVVTNDSATIARGAHLMATRPCGGCHGDDLGGTVMADAGPLAMFAAPNLTSGRGGRNSTPYTDVEWERAIRHGVRRDGTGLIVMPSEVFHGIADDEMAAIIAYLKQAPPVDRETVSMEIRWLGRIVIGAGRAKTAAQLVPKSEHIATIDTTPSLDFGKYLVSVAGCRSCHGESLSGVAGDGPDDPPAANLTPAGIGHYTEADFMNTLRTGNRPKGGGALKEPMPWKYFGRMTDGELHSIWLYLKSIPPKQFAES